MKKKTKIKPLRKIPMGWDKKGYEYASILLEDIRSNNKLLAEGLSIVSEKQTGIIKEVGFIKEEITGIKISQEIMREDISVLKEDVSVLKEDVSVLKEDVSVLKEDVSVLKDKQISTEYKIEKILNELKFIKNELEFIKDKLTNKADIEFLKNLENRVKIIEETLNLSK